MDHGLCALDLSLICLPAILRDQHDTQASDRLTDRAGSVELVPRMALEDYFTPSAV